MTEQKPTLDEACARCSSFCCTYYALPLDDPEDKNDFDDLRWFLMHEGNYIYVEDGDWYLNITSRCRHILPNGRCGIYEHRPRICREHGDGDEPCEFFSDYQFEERFFTPEEIECYAVRELLLPREDVKDWLVYDDKDFWRTSKEPK